MPSIGVDDIGRTECFPIHARHKQQVLDFACLRTPAQVARNCEPQWTARSNRPNVNVQAASQQAAEHERRGECIFRACCEYTLAAAEFHVVRSLIGSQRKCPGDVSRTVANQKEQFAFQLLHDGLHLRYGQPHLGRDLDDGDGLLNLRQLADNEGSHGMMSGGHEVQAFTHFIRGPANCRLPFRKGFPLEIRPVRNEHRLIVVVLLHFFNSLRTIVLMYHSTTMALLFFGATYTGIAQNPYAVCPRNYRLELENDWVRVSRAMFAPGDKLPVHDHPARPAVFVYLTDGGPIRFTHIQPEFTAERPAVREGGIRFHTGAKETHVVEYLGDAPSEYLRIELKTERPEKKSQHVRIAADDLRPFENSQIRVSRFLCESKRECAPLEYPGLVVRLNERSVSWYEAGSAIKNESDEMSRQIRIELKTSPLAGGLP